ncbi:UBA and UBX domain-containing protein [Glycine soja]|nr:UBA and UBX domain-containing protein [Glycine soja]
MASRDNKKASSSRAGRIRTLSDLNRPSADSDSDSDGPQEYYTGGEKSGMLVQDPSKGNDVDEIFNQARQLGAVERPLDQLQEPPRSTSFTGTGSIKKSECPKELEPEDRRSSVNVNLIRRNENYREPEKQHVAFQGVGRTLGSSSTSMAPDPPAASTPPNTAPTPSAGLVVDQSLPSTSIQLRLADGTRLISHFNYHHTISDIRAFIDASRPGGRQNYQLQLMGFPPKILADETQTIEQAGLANSVVIQKF